MSEGFRHPALVFAASYAQLEAENAKQGEEIRDLQAALRELRAGRDVPQLAFEIEDE